MLVYKRSNGEFRDGRCSLCIFAAPVHAGVLLQVKGKEGERVVIAVALASLALRAAPPAAPIGHALQSKLDISKQQGQHSLAPLMCAPSAYCGHIPGVVVRLGGI